MINELTKYQENGIVQWREHCLEIGRDTSYIDKKLTEKSWKKIYKILGKKEPKFFYCQSPLQAQITINFLKKINNKNLGENIGKNIWKNIEENIGKNIWENIRENIWENIRENIWKNIRKNIGDNIMENIWKNIRKNIGDNIMENIWKNIWKNIRDNIWKNIGENIEENIGENINGMENFEFIETYFWGQHNIGLISYYKYFEKYGLLKTDNNFKIFDIWYDLARSCGWCYTFENIVFVCEKPSELNLNDNGLIHKDGGMALKYSDGYGLYMLNGVNVPKYLAVTTESELNIDFFKKEKNADIKAEFIRKYGIERMVHLGLKIDSHNNYSNKLWAESEYELIDMSSIFESIDYAPHLKMKNLTTGIWHMDGIDPRCRNLEEALDFRMKSRHNNITAIK